MGFDKVLESEDTGVELGYLGGVVGFPLFDGFEQRLSDALQSVGVKVGAAIEDVSCRTGRDGVVGDSVSGWNGDRRW